MDLANESFAENNALQEEAARRFETTDSKLQVQKNRWAALSATVGETFNKIWVPVFTAITTFFTEKLPLAFKVFKFQAITVFNGVAGALGSLVNSVIDATNLIIRQLSRISDSFAGLELERVDFTVDTTPILSEIANFNKKKERLRKESADKQKKVIDSEIKAELDAISKIS